MSTVTVIKYQSLFDLSIQVYGTQEGVLILAMANGLSVTDELEPGSVLKVPEFAEANTEIVSYYRANNIKPATALGATDKKIIENNNGNNNACNLCQYFA